ncbi:MAG: GTP-binding protein [Planctomycetales bacterium]|nr:GTP-binding protein [Planctomycetales bacterium]
MTQKKICMLGSFAVGKTSLVRRFVYSTFSDKYHTTIGVKVDRKSVQVEGTAVDMMLWDLHGDDDLQGVKASYLRGMSGYLLVADGTRPDTLDRVKDLYDLAIETVGDVPFALLINKHDLTDLWAVSDEALTELAEVGWHIRLTSAKSGENVDETFQWLAERML